MSLYSNHRSRRFTRLRYLVQHQAPCKAPGQGLQLLRLTLCQKRRLCMCLLLPQASHHVPSHPCCTTGHHRVIMLPSKPSPSSCALPCRQRDHYKRSPTVTLHPKSRLHIPLPLPQGANRLSSQTGQSALRQILQQGTTHQLPTSMSSHHPHLAQALLTPPSLVQSWWT